MIRAFAIVLTSVLLAQPTFAEGLKVVMLGTGTPMSYPDRSGPGVAIISGGETYIIDSGAGIFRKAREAEAMGIMELAPPKLDKIFLTHLHSDHTTGLANMILAPWVLRRDQPLRLYGPPGTKHMADHILEAYSEDIDMRLHGSQPANPNGYKVESHEFSIPGIIFEDDNVMVEAIKVPHGSWKYAYAYKFTEKKGGKTALISGDTAKSEDLMKAAMGVDILVHEVISEIALNKRTEDWQVYHRAFHTLPQELAEIANKVKPRLLVLYHQLYWDKADDNLAEEVKAAGYHGKVVSANDLDIFE
ncbi:MAG: MBL fold metallo-hydrolase [Emcibacteraceae bacterium]